METIAEKNFELIWDSDPKHASNLAKRVFKKM